MVAEFSPGHRVQRDWEPCPEIRKDDGVPVLHKPEGLGSPSRNVLLQISTKQEGAERPSRNVLL